MGQLLIVVVQPVWVAVLGHYSDCPIQLWRRFLTSFYVVIILCRSLNVCISSRTFTMYLIVFLFVCRICEISPQNTVYLSLYCLIFFKYSNVLQSNGMAEFVHKYEMNVNTLESYKWMCEEKRYFRAKWNSKKKNVVISN